MTILYTHPIFAQHETPQGHPEQSARMKAVETALEDVAGLDRRTPEMAGYDLIVRAHPGAYLERMEALIPDEGIIGLDPDTAMGPHSWDAARHASGAACAAVDAVIAGEDKTAFVAARPPGHHAEKTRAMGFCMVNHIAVAALHARAAHGVERVAIVDFDVHHGNGTQDIFYDEPNVFYASTHQSPHYPGTGAANERGAGNILNVPLPGGLPAMDYRTIFSAAVMPALNAFRPELVLVSAGFDAHAADPLGDFNLTEPDFVWITEQLLTVAHDHAGGRVVSLLEGGYDLPALGRSAAAHVTALARA